MILYVFYCKVYSIMPKISVIVPVYRAKKFIEECTRSILAQEGADFELLLIDDASDDGSEIFCDRLASEHENIRVIHAPHGGAAAARNRGLKEATGEYIAFIDSDDTVEPDYLVSLQTLIEETGAPIAVCAHDDGRKKCRCGCGGCCGEGCCHDADIHISTDPLSDLLYQRKLMSVPWGMLVRKELWKGLEFPEGAEAEDMATIYKLFMRAGTLVYTSEALYHYRQHSGSTIISTRASRRIAYYKNCRRMIKDVRELRPDCMDAARCRHFSACAQNLSETALGDCGTFMKRLYKDMKILAPAILRDRNARLMNRAAAVPAMISPRLVHCLLRAWYVCKNRTMIKR